MNNQSHTILGAVAVGILGLFLPMFLIFASAFGFFASDDSLREVMAQIDREYQQEIQDICDDVEHDDLNISGQKAEWITVLAVYAVKVGADDDLQIDVSTMDDTRAALLRQVFWDMNAITWETETYEIPNPDYSEETEPSETEPEETEPEETEPAETEPEETTPKPSKPSIPIYTPLSRFITLAAARTSSSPTIKQTRLLITKSCRSVDEMVDFYGFTSEQEALLQELLLPENQDFWDAILSGI